MRPHYNGSKWAQSKLGDLEKLISEGNADDCDAENQAQQEAAQNSPSDTLDL